MGKVIKERNFNCESEYRTIFEVPLNTQIIDAIYYPSTIMNPRTDELLVIWTLEETSEYYTKETELHEVLVVGVNWEMNDNLELFEYLASSGDNVERFHIFTRKLESPYPTSDTDIGI